ncbi:MAG: hypothetical protein CMF24_08650 [Ilumatobacter sp.]|nr:hypothetical protein [Ilumatobacter sp.]
MQGFAIRAPRLRTRAAVTAADDTELAGAPPVWRFDRMETNLVLVMELALIFLVAVAVCLILGDPQIPALYLLVAVALGAVLSTLGLLFACLVYRPAHPLRATSAALIATGAVLATLLVLSLVIALLTASTFFGDSRTTWLFALHLEPAFAYESPEAVHLAQLVALISVLSITAAGALLTLAQLTHATRAASGAAPPSPLLVYAQHAIAHVNIAPALRAAAVLGGGLQEYYHGVLVRVCDEIGPCRYNTANLAQVVRSDDVLVQTAVLLLLALVFEVLGTVSAVRIILDAPVVNIYANTDGHRITLGVSRAALLVLVVYTALLQSAEYLPGTYPLHCVLAAAGVLLTCAETLSELSPDGVRDSIVDQLADAPRVTFSSRTAHLKTT